MDKIDRLGWAAGITFVSYGLRIGIRVSSPEIMDRIKGLLPPKAKPARGPRVERLYSLIVSGTKAGSHVRRIHVLCGSAGTVAGLGAGTRSAPEGSAAIRGRLGPPRGVCASG